MHQYCLLNCACYIINTHPDMTWIWYDKGIRGEELEKERSECIFHELQSSPAKVLDMMFQFQRRKKGARRAREANMWLLRKQTWDFACNRTRADRPTSLITHPGDNFDRGPCAFLSATGSRPRSKKKKKTAMWYNILSSFSSTDVSTSDGLWRYCSCWYLIKVKAGFL